MMKQRLLEALRKIRDEGPARRGEGICANVYVMSGRSMAIADMLDPYLISWPGNTLGSYAYPVAGPTEYGGSQRSGTLWLITRRIELLNWIIVQLEETLNVE